MTPSGPAVLLPQATDKPTHPRQSSFGAELWDESDDEDEKHRPGHEEPRSAISQMLYTRWLMNLKVQCESTSLWLEAPT